MYACHRTHCLYFMGCYTNMRQTGWTAFNMTTSKWNDFLTYYFKLHKTGNSMNKNMVLYNTSTCVRDVYSTYNAGHVIMLIFVQHYTL